MATDHPMTAGATYLKRAVLCHFFPLALAAAFVGGLQAGIVDPRYHETLYTLCDGLVATQITATDSADRGALVCPSVNPQEHPLHPRAGEAVYPLAIAYRETHKPAYRDAAVLLGRWMISKQRPTGEWGEEWPRYDGWTGTTADQLISLAGAYPVLHDQLSAEDRKLWTDSIRRAAAYVAAKFPLRSNINYEPTGAVALLLAAKVVENPPLAWRSKAEELANLIVSSVNQDGFIVGEGNGVDLGYNIAQSIGFVALYGLLTGNEGMRDKAAELLKTHFLFVYPNGSIDNSWGTRSFKWLYESGTKTAPGVYFTFALLADKDPRFAVAGRRCLDFLTDHTIHDHLVTYGPHSGEHSSTRVPCLYSTFARAQSIAMAITYGREATSDNSAIPADELNWFRFFPTINVAVVRTAGLMATVSAYGEVSRYGRSAVTRGGSITNLWLEGFGHDGFAQTSSVTTYQREEKSHMPEVSAAKPLTSQIQTTIAGVVYTNLFEATAKMEVAQESDHIRVTTTGKLRSSTGDSCGVSYRLTHRFYANALSKDYDIVTDRPVKIRVIEPVVLQPGLAVNASSKAAVSLKLSTGRKWRIEWSASVAVPPITVGEDAENYWCPFPAVACVPIIQNCEVAGAGRISMSFRPD